MTCLWSQLVRTRTPVFAFRPVAFFCHSALGNPRIFFSRKYSRRTLLPTTVAKLLGLSREICWARSPGSV